MEYFELLNMDGTPAGRVKERNQVHKDGDLHGGSHIWVIRKTDMGIEILLQKRSKDKDSFPGCFDISSAGHVAKGEDFLSTAVREIKEELNLTVKEENLTFLFSQYVEGRHVFHNETFFNREINYVYLLNLDVSLDDLKFQEEEIEGLKWMDARELKRVVQSGDENYCIWKEEYEKLYQYLQNENIIEH